MGAHINFGLPPDAVKYNQLYNTGSLLYNLIIDISGGGGGSALATGQALTNSLNSLSGFTTGISGYLYNIIQNSANGVISVNGQSGILTIVGTGGITVNALNQNIYVSGQDWALRSELTQSGIDLILRDNSISGVLEQRLAIVSGVLDNKITTVSDRLIQTGTILVNRDLDISGALEVRIAESGQANYNLFTGLYGQLYNTGQLLFTREGQISGALQANIDNLNIRLQQSGSNLYILITGLSGQLVSDFATKAQLTQSGIDLINRDFLISGTLATGIVQSGNAVIAHANGIGQNLSGIIGQTGNNLYNMLTAMSGALTGRDFSISGGIQIQIGQTGQQAIAYVNLVSGALQALITQADADVNSINGQSGTLQITGAGNIFVSSGGVGIITINGDTGAYANFATKIDLTQSGIDLLSRIAQSGQTNYSLMTSASGTLQVQINSISLQLYQTGSNIYNLITGMSGQAVLDYATKIQLTQSGINLLSNIAQTGSNLYNIITGQSGQAIIDYATKTQLTQSGINLINIINNTGNSVIIHSNGIGSGLSGIIGTTGSNLYNLLINESGALKLEIANTGQQAWNTANNNGINLSGSLTQSGIQLILRENTISGILQTQIDSTSSSLINVVYTSGAQFISGTKYFIGNTYIDNLFITGKQIVVNTQDIYVGNNWMVLNSTGGARDSAIFVSTGITGANATGGIIGFDVPSNTWVFGIGGYQTDLASLPKIASITDILNASGGLEARIYLTGAAAISYINSVGSIVSGNLTQTGITLWNRDVIISGVLEQRVFDTGLASIQFGVGIGNILSGNLTNSGISLINIINSTSGALTGRIYQTGFDLYNQLYNTGQTLTNRIDSVSGGLQAQINVTGQSSIIYSNGIGINLSGSLIQTGISLLSIIANSGQQAWLAANNNAINLSGNLTLTGTLLSALKVTGSTVQNILNIIGTGTIQSWTSGVNFYLSGNQNDAINLSGVIALTGQQAWNTANNNAVNLSGNLTITGQTLRALIIGGDTNLSGVIAQSGSNLYNIITGASGQGVFDYATKTQLYQTGSNLYNIVTGFSGQSIIDFATKTQLTQTGITLQGRIDSLSGYVGLVSGGLEVRISASGNAAISHSNGIGSIISGNLTLTGQTLYNLLTSASGQFNVNYAPAAANYVYQTGVQNITGIKTFVSELRFNSGLKTPVQFFGPSNYTLTSGNYTVIATGVTSSTTGILPSSVDYSGVYFNLINGGSTSLQISGIIGPDVNPILAPWDAIEIYATSGQWWYVRQTGSPLLGMINSLSGYAGNISGALQTIINNTGQQAWLAANNNGINLSGGLTQTGVTLRALILGGDTNLSGNLTQTGISLLTTIASTGQQSILFASGASGILQTQINNLPTTAYVNGIGVNLSGNLTLSGQALQNLIFGGDTNLSGNLTQTGITLRNLILGGDSNLSGTIATTGQQAILFASGSSGNLQSQINALPTTAYVNGIGINLSGNLTQTGITLVNQIAGLSGVVNTLYGTNILYTTGNQNVGGIKTFGSGAFTGWVNIGRATVLSDNPLAISGSGVFLQSTIQNNSKAPDASSDWVATSDIGSNTFGFIDIGINNSNYNQTGYTVGSGSDGYLSVNGGNLTIGTETIGKVIRFYTSGPIWQNARVTIDDGGISLITGASVKVSGIGAFYSGGIDITNLYYPRNSNPSGFITGLAGTGSLATLNQLNSLSGQVGVISGVLATGIAQTGQQAWSAAQNNAINLSGNLTQTGVTLGAQITALSGYAAPNSAAYFYRTGVQTVTGNTTIQGNLTLISGQYEPQKTITADYSILATDTRLYCNNTSPITLTFPSLASVSGQKIAIKLINTGTVILTGTFGQKFDGSDSYVIVGQYTTRELHGADASNWYLW